jgi:HD superfamily phosphohydrolase
VQFNPSRSLYRPVVLCGALLHDLGHGPFSHTGEEIFSGHHEHWTVRILQESPPVRQALDQFQPDLVEHLIQVYTKSYPVPLVWQLVTSQLDCDRLDYLMRDSYFTGTTYGKIDLERILMALRYDPETQQLAVMQKGMAAIEHYLIVRYFMYAQVYNHPKNIAASWVLQQASSRARKQMQVGQLEADETVHSWLTQDCDQLPLKLYLAADDGVFNYHLQRWQQSEDLILADLCRRSVDRDLLKARDISHLDESDRLNLLNHMQDWLTKVNLDPQIYSGLRVSLNRGYTLYQRGIKVETANGLEELSHLSPLVQMLTTPYERVWLIYPREIEPQLLNFLPRQATV